MFSPEQLEAFKSMSAGKRKPKQLSTSTTQMSGMHPLKKEMRPKAEKLKPKPQDTSTVDKIRAFRTTMEGVVTFGEIISPDERTEINALSQWTLDEFVNVESKQFNFFELC